MVSVSLLAFNIIYPFACTFIVAHFALYVASCIIAIFIFCGKEYAWQAFEFAYWQERKHENGIA